MNRVSPSTRVGCSTTSTSPSAGNQENTTRSILVTDPPGAASSRWPGSAEAPRAARAPPPSRPVCARASSGRPLAHQGERYRRLLPHSLVDAVESFWSFANRRPARFNGTRANLERHLKECEGRWRKNHDTAILELSGLPVQALPVSWIPTVEDCPNPGKAPRFQCKDAGCGDRSGALPAPGRTFHSTPAQAPPPAIPPQMWITRP